MYDLPKKSIIQYKSFIRNFKILKNEKIVILHFRSSQSSFSDEKEHLNRNVNPKSYYSLIKILCKKGYRVVRIGDSGVDINIKDKNFINYGNLNIRSSYLDLALVANCNFFVGSSSGAVYFAAVFGKPILGLNMCMPFNFSPSGKSNEIGVPKLFKSKKTQKLLSLKEIFNYKLHYVRSADDPLMKFFEFVDNDENDIVKACEEMIDFLDYPQKRRSVYKKISNIFRSIKKEFEVDDDSLSNFSESFFKRHRKTLLKGIKK